MAAISERDYASGGPDCFQRAPARAGPEGIGTVFCAECGQGIEAGWVEFGVEGVVEGGGVKTLAGEVVERAFYGGWEGDREVKRKGTG